MKSQQNKKQLKKQQHQYNQVNVVNHQVNVANQRHKKGKLRKSSSINSVYNIQSQEEDYQKKCIQQLQRSKSTHKYRNYHRLARNKHQKQYQIQVKYILPKNRLNAQSTNSRFTQSSSNRGINLLGKQAITYYYDSNRNSTSDIYSVSSNNNNLFEDKQFLLSQKKFHPDYKLFLKLEQQIKNVKPEDHLRLLLIKAKIFEDQAEKMTKKHVLTGLQYWRKTLEEYQKINALEKSQNIKGLLGQIKCLLRLHKYAQAHKLLYKNAAILKNEYAYWILFSQYQRRTNRILKSKQKLFKATDILKRHQIEYPLIQKDKRLLKNLQKYNYAEKIKAADKIKEIILQGRQKKLTQKYKIVTMDGGGWRGIAPTFWLSQLERKLRKPISQLFNMGAGTSIGGMMIAGLCLPGTQQNSLRPLVTACDLVKNYKQMAKDMFTPNGLMSTFTSKYKNEGKYAVINKFSGNTKISQSLMDLVIPAVSNSNMGHTHIFTSRQAKINHKANLRITDVCMATTAAPTYYPVHHIQGFGNFIDGGLQANNPSRLALNQALRYGYNADDIIMLSLGTGLYDYVTNIDTEQKDRNVLYWATNIIKFTIAGQQSSTDSDMYLHLKDRYHRWQFYLDRPIQIDDCSQQTTDHILSLANQYLQQLQVYDDNRMNKLLQKLDE